MNQRPAPKYRPNMTVRPKNGRRQALTLDRKLGRDVSDGDRARHEQLIGEINRAFDRHGR